MHQGRAGSAVAVVGVGISGIGQQPAPPWSEPWLGTPPVMGWIGIPWCPASQLRSGQSSAPTMRRPSGIQRVWLTLQGKDEREKMGKV